MEIKYLGTAAAEGVPAMFCKCPVCENIRALGGKNLRTRTQILIDGELCIDFPPEAYAHSLAFGFNCADIKYLLVTHSHMDHFYAHDFILRGYRYAECFSSPLKIYGNSEVAAVFAECTRREMKPAVAPNVQMHEIKPYSQFEVGGYSVLTLPANHGSAEQAMLFYVSKGGKGYLHMHDTSVPEDGIYSYLKSNGAKADLVSFDCTYVDRTGIARPRHMNIEDCMAVKQKLVEAGVCGEKTKYVITHFSHNSNPVVERLAKLESKYSVIAAYDGMSIVI